MTKLLKRNFKAFNSGNAALIADFKAQKSKVAKKVCVDKIAYFSNKLSDVSDSKTFWKAFHNVCGRNSAQVLPLQTDDGRIISDNSAIADLLADYIQSICSARAYRD